MKYRLTLKEDYKSINFLFDTVEEIVEFIKTCTKNYDGEYSLDFHIEQVEEDEEN